MARVVYSSISLPQNPTNYFGFSYFRTNRKASASHCRPTSRAYYYIMYYYHCVHCVCAVYPPKGYSSHAHGLSSLPVTYVVFSAHDRKCCQNDYCKNMQKSVLSRINRLRPARRWRVHVGHVDIFLILRFHLLVFFFKQLYEFVDRNPGWYRSRKILCYINEGGNVANRTLGFGNYSNNNA